MLIWVRAVNKSYHSYSYQIYLTLTDWRYFQGHGFTDQGHRQHIPEEGIPIDGSSLSQCHVDLVPVTVVSFIKILRIRETGAYLWPWPSTFWPKNLISSCFAKLRQNYKWHKIPTSGL